MYSLVIAIVIPAVEVAVEEAEVEVQNVTNVVELGISLVHARILLVREEEATLHSIVVITAVRRRLGKWYFSFHTIFFFWLIVC